MDGGYRVENDRLRELSRNLADQADVLRPPACGPVAKPDAGRSSGEAGGAFTHLLDATTDLGRVFAEMAERLRETAESYDAADSQAAGELERVARRMPGP